jgi:hypothetical protein
MNKLLLLAGVISLFDFPAYADPFAPNLLKLSAPPVVQYLFDGSVLSLPVAVSGNPANVTLLVFTLAHAATITRVTNGYWGWHYVNRIDTCVYISPPFQFNPGSHALSWDGKNENGSLVPAGDYTYYIWGFDNVSPRALMSSRIKFDPWNFRTIITYDTQGIPLSQPIICVSDHNRSSNQDPVNHTCSRWTVGNDPMDASLLETTITSGWCDVGGLAFQPDDYRYFFHDTWKSSGTNITRKWQWVPGGEAILQTNWGRNGEFSYSGAWPDGLFFGPGVVSDGADYLLTATYDISGDSTSSELIYINIHDGTEIKRFDLTPWWVRPQDEERGGQRFGGPTELFIRNGLLGLGCHSSCLNQLIDPYSQTINDAILWSNGNGDNTGDKNWTPGSDKAWVCNDNFSGPYKYNISMDENLFTAFPCFDINAESFGLYAPDGTGMGYFALSQENKKQKYGVEFIDYGSAYDGMYITNNDIPGEWDIDTSFWFVGHDSVKGSIVPSGSYIFVASPVGGEVWASGMTHRIVWQSVGIQTVRIEFSIDGGSSWTMLVDGIDASAGGYDWTPVGIDSNKCLVRVTSTAYSSKQGSSRSLFTITPQFLKVTSPNGDEKWKEGETRQITWLSTEIATRIEFSADNGMSWSTLVASVPAYAFSFSWRVPKISSTNCLVRVIDIGTSGLSDVSDGVFTITTAPVGVAEEIPRVFTVFPNTPNPFNPSTEIRFAIPQTGQVSVDVYNISGQKVTTLLYSERSAGVHTVRWDASGMSAGLYFCRVRGCGEQRTIKMMLVK